MIRTRLSLSARKAIFLALVAAQDRGLSVRTSYAEVTLNHGLTDAQLRAIEDEGLDHDWLDGDEQPAEPVVFLNLFAG